MCMHKLEHTHTVYIDMYIHTHHAGPVVPQVVLTKKIRNSEEESMTRMGTARGWNPCRISPLLSPELGETCENMGHSF